MKATTSEKTRHLLLRAAAGEILPDALVDMLRDEAVACGWLRASGVLTDVELRATSVLSGALGEVRRVVGPVQVLSLEGSVGLANGDVSIGMRAVLARETDRGLETLAGEITAARVIALEAHVVAFDDIGVGRSLDAPVGMWLLGDTPAPSPQRPAAKAADPAWSHAAATSADVEREPPRRTPAQTSSMTQGVMPQRPVKAGSVLDDMQPLPEVGDEVDHFAFGRCDVLKSDGDRLHLKVHKDGRIREIALEMLRVMPLPPEGERRRYKLERRL